MTYGGRRPTHAERGIVTPMPEYAELRCQSYFSLLAASSSPEALAERAGALGLRGLALTDVGSLAGAVRFSLACRKAGVRAILGATVTVDEGDGAGYDLVLLAENQTGYRHLCQTLTLGLGGTPEQLDAEGDVWLGKRPCRVTLANLAARAEGVIALTAWARGPALSALQAGHPQQALARLRALRECFGPHGLFVELDNPLERESARHMRQVAALAEQAGLACVAAGGARYHDRARARLLDALIAIDAILPLSEARRQGLLPTNDALHLFDAAEAARRFAAFPAAMARSVEIAERCAVSLDFSADRVPPHPDGSSDPEADNARLAAECEQGLITLYGSGEARVRLDVARQRLAGERVVIARAGLAGYLLIVADIVRFARGHGIRCQGRGSAAGSIVAYLLGITAVDPIAQNLLFERFLSDDRFIMPDIDVDFDGARREEVIQHVYETYGRERCAMVCNYVTFQARAAARDLGKALGMPQDAIDAVARDLQSRSATRSAELLAADDPDAATQAPNHPHRLLRELMVQIDGVPRHLSVHPGGMTLTARPISDIVPVEPATMEGRTVIQWDKESMEDAGLIKTDLLSLRTLGLVSDALDLAGLPQDHLTRVGLDDPALYEMMQRGDTIGAFQIESRAQMQMLPRLKPRRFEDITIEVAIVRPGPIQGGAVHPYLRRRTGEEPVRYLHPCLEPALAETLGVMIFQEQTIRVAVAASDFTPGEADTLRRALSRGEVDEALRERFLRGALRKGIAPEVAAEIFAQVAGFAGFGFNKSHAASFALITYQTMWLKRYQPLAFYCALLNNQPIGFYPAEVILGEAKRHGIPIHGADVNASRGRYRIEAGGIRLSLAEVKGLGPEYIARIEAGQPFASLDDLHVRAGLPRPLIADLIRAGACDAFGERRALLWALGDTRDNSAELPLDLPASPVPVAPLPAAQATLWEYELTGMSASTQIVSHHRARLTRQGCVTAAQARSLRAGTRVRIGGLIAVRQRPGTAGGVMFLSLEDESGLVDVVLKPETYQRARKLLTTHKLVVVSAVVQRNGEAVSFLASTVEAMEG
ncbi:MAG: error-prone DNA polymerase, partial [Thermoflexales bacterium]|nr:error-prone DNA polymerase [Thermoflexales bacterium]